MTRGKQPVSPVGPLPSSAAGFAIGARDCSHNEPCLAAPAMSVAAEETCHQVWEACG